MINIVDKINLCNSVVNNIVTQGCKRQLDHILEEIEMRGVNVGHFDGTTKYWH